MKERRQYKTKKKQKILEKQEIEAKGDIKTYQLLVEPGSLAKCLFVMSRVISI